MNRQEAIHVIRKSISGFIECELHDALDMAMEALEGPTPDPTTGLVPCGCGGPVQLLEDNYCSYWVECAGCGIKLGYWESMDDGEPNGSFGKKRDAVKVWNTAMGWKGGAE